MGRALRTLLGSMAGAILGFALGVVVLIGNATPMRSPVVVFTVLGAAGGATLGIRARKGLGVGRASFVVVALALALVAVVAFAIAQQFWHWFEHGQIHF
jgi:hypothetical protein